MIGARLFDRYLRGRGRDPRWRAAAHTSLERLALVAIDCETTGLDTSRDRIVSIAAIRISEGLQVIDAPVLDLLINPAIAIPPRATAIHGIDASTVSGAPTFGEAFESIESALQDCVVVGHHIGFDLELLAREARRADKPWREPPSLDTARLAPLLGLSAARTDLADMLGRLGMQPRGERHSAVGDARMAADLFVAIARRLIGDGHGTFAGALAAQAG